VQKADQPAAALPLPNDLTEPAAEKGQQKQQPEQEQQEQQQRQDTVAHLNADGQLCYWAGATSLRPGDGGGWTSRGE
jgi:hypothetical protein